MWKRVWLGAAFVVALAAASTSSADAQIIPEAPKVWAPPLNAQHPFDPTVLPVLSDPATRDPVAIEDTPVKNRKWPEYQPPGIRAGAWMFNPAATASAFYDSNVFSSNTNQESDVFTRLGASLSAKSLWERHGVNLQASTLSTFYRQNSGLNQTDASLRGTGHVDIDHATMLLAAFEASYLHEAVGSLSSPANAIEPTPYGFLSGDLTLRREFGRFTGSVGARVDSYDFGSTVAQNGMTIDQDARDGQIYVAHGRIDYAFSEKLAAFTALEGNTRRLRGSPEQSLSSDGYRALAGFDLELTPLIKGEIAGGYMAQRFDDATIGTLEGPAYRAMLTWSPSRRLDIYFNAEQIVATASDTSLTAVRADTAQVGFDYEFRPNVILSTAAAYERDHFEGQARDDNVYILDAKLTYLLNNISSLAFRYRYKQRDSSLPEFNFDKHLVGVTATARF